MRNSFAESGQPGYKLGIEMRYIAKNPAHHAQTTADIRWRVTTRGAVPRIRPK